MPEENLQQVLKMLDHYKRMYDIYFDKMIQRLDQQGISKQASNVRITHDDLEAAKPTEMNIFKRNQDGFIELVQDDKFEAVIVKLD
jgi:hypothetical protein